MYLRRTWSLQDFRRPATDIWRLRATESQCLMGSRSSHRSDLVAAHTGYGGDVEGGVRVEMPRLRQEICEVARENPVIAQ